MSWSPRTISIVGRRYHGLPEGHEAVVKLLFEKGAELESKSKNGQTPLSWAAVRGHEVMVKLLLEKSAELEPKDDTNGRMLLSWCQLL